jgi:uncharacterized radical SAM superfamily Fe-S cluster-containing enzyme
MDDLEKERNIKLLQNEVISLKNKFFQANNEKIVVKKQFEKIELMLKQLSKENKELKQELDKIKKK